MSRIGKKPVPLAGGVKVSVQDHLVKIEGPKGKLELTVHPLITVNLDDAKKELVVTRPDDERQSKALHGLTRALLNNMVIGVSQGYKKTLEVQGVGYKAEMKGKNLVLSVGFANTVTVPIPGDVTVQLEGVNKVHVSGADKQAVGEFAAQPSRTRAKASVMKAKWSRSSRARPSPAQARSDEVEFEISNLKFQIEVDEK